VRLERLEFRSAARGPAGASRRPGTGALYATVYAAVFMSNLDLFVVNVALPDIGRTFHDNDLSYLSWVLNGYAIAFAALLVVAGRLFDRHGHRRGFLLGLVVFTGSSAWCAVATNVGWLVSARILQAVGAAVLLPTSLALLLAITPAGRRGRVVRTWSAVGGVAAALGPVVGGLLVQASWRWVFLINLPVGVLALTTGLRVLPADRRREPGPEPDMLGALLLTTAIGLFALGLVEGNAWGWSSSGIIASLAAAPILLALFLRRSGRHRAPVVELPLLRLRPFSAATVAMLLFAVTFAGMLLAVSLWCQNVWGYSALKTGLAMAPGPLMVPPMAAMAGPAARRAGNGAVAAFGNVLFAAGLLYWALHWGLTSGYAAGMLPGYLIGGAGVGLALPTLTAAGATALPIERFATGTAILTMARQIGAVLGVAILVLVLGSARNPLAAQGAFHHGWYEMAAAELVTAIACLAMPRSPGTRPTTGSQSASQRATASR
jgi:EmrB/QacA subfamily drug resistance transporter